jgi:Haem-binding uptake, Tiki superfamily, ChaN
VERTIRATDTKSRRKYLRDFNNAFVSYRRILKIRELEARLVSSNIVLVGDYHALPASQRFTAALVERLVALGKKVVLGVEAIVARDQHILDEWQQGEIDSDELRSRIRFESDWGYDWQPFSEMLERARAADARVFGLDCTPRQDMRSIRARDRHAAVKIAELRLQHPDCIVVVLFGESHLAPSHLPALLKELRPRDVALTLLQNVDALYWMSAGEPQDLVEAVEVSDEVVCVFSATPLEKYEHYRLCIEGWKQARVGAIDLAPSFYNLIASLFRFLDVNPYAVRGEKVSSFLVDQLPEVWSVTSEEQLERLLMRRISTRVSEVLQAVTKHGSCYVPERNAIIAQKFRMPWAAEQASRFVHDVCRGAKRRFSTRDDDFYLEVLESALGFVGSKVLCPSRKLYTEEQLKAEFSKADHAFESAYGLSKRAYRQVLDCVAAHQTNARRRGKAGLQLVLNIEHLDSAQRQCATVMLGHMLGSAIYAAYVRGDISKRFLRRLFFKDLSQPGSARTAYFDTAKALMTTAALRRLRMVS